MSNSKQSTGLWATYRQVPLIVVSKALLFTLEHTEDLGQQVLPIAWDGSVTKLLFHTCPCYFILSATVGLQSHLPSPTIHENYLLIALSSSEGPSLFLISLEL